MTTQVNAPIDWRNPPPPTPDDRRIRLHELLDRTGFKSHRSIYDRIADFLNKHRPVGAAQESGN